METTQLYLELSDYYHQRGEAQSRDRFLVLAADAAMNAGNREEADQLRKRLLSLNPHHLLKPFKSFEEAVKSRDVTDYINALRRRHPADQVAKLVETTVRSKPDRASDPEPTPHLHVPPPQPTGLESAPAQRSPDAFRVRPADDLPPIGIRPRPIPPPPALPSPPANTGRLRPVPGLQRTPLSLAPLPLPPEPSRASASSPFRPQQHHRPQPSVPVSQGHRMAATPGAWLCSILFVILLVGGIGLTIYSLGRVFLPNELIPVRILPAHD